MEKTVGQVLSNWHPLIETPPKDSTDPTDVNEDSSRKKRKSGNDEDKDEIDNENQKAVKLQRKYFNIVINMQGGKMYFFNPLPDSLDVPLSIPIKRTQPLLNIF